MINASGKIKTDGHPFFPPSGTNGRACVNCHQPAYRMSVSSASLQERWQTTRGKNPVFAAFDGSNCPNLPQDPQEFSALYSFNDDHLVYRANQVVTEAAGYAKRIGAKSLKVTGYRGETALSNGNRMVEKPGLAEKARPKRRRAPTKFGRG